MLVLAGEDLYPSLTRNAQSVEVMLDACRWQLTAVAVGGSVSAGGDEMAAGGYAEEVSKSENEEPQTPSKKNNRLAQSSRQVRLLYGKFKRVSCKWQHGLCVTSLANNVSND